MNQDYAALTGKEKETLRLMVRGHDAKSMASALDLSVHTINDRLRAARRKLSVTSSREAARLLFEHEAAVPENRVHEVLGDAPEANNAEQSQLSKGRRGDGLTARRVLAWSIGGLVAMSLLVSLFLVASPLAEPFAGGDASHSSMSQTEVALAEAEVETAARDWLSAVDRGDWAVSYETTGSAFRKLNTLAAWQAASEDARVPLGAVVSREATAFEWIAAPPHGYRLIRFRTDFAERKSVVENVTLEREDGKWRVVGYVID